MTYGLLVYWTVLTMLASKSDSEIPTVAWNFFTCSPKTAKNVWRAIRQISGTNLGAIMRKVPFCSGTSLQLRM